MQAEFLPCILSFLKLHENEGKRITATEISVIYYRIWNGYFLWMLGNQLKNLKSKKKNFSWKLV